MDSVKTDAFGLVATGQTYLRNGALYTSDGRQIAVFMRAEDACSILGGFTDEDAFNADQRVKREWALGAAARRKQALEDEAVRRGALYAIPLTKRQAEALWCARKWGTPYRLKADRQGGSLIKMVGELRRRGYIERLDITQMGRQKLAEYEAEHPKELQPFTG